MDKYQYLKADNFFAHSSRNSFKVSLELCHFGLPLLTRKEEVFKVLQRRNAIMSWRGRFRFLWHQFNKVQVIEKTKIKQKTSNCSTFCLSYFLRVDFGCRCTSAISSLASCSLSGLLAHSSLASVSLFFCSTAWASCQRCHAFIRWSNDPCSPRTHRGSFHVYI